MKNVSKYKEQLEKDINEKLVEFTTKTGLSVSWVDFKKEKPVGFKKEEDGYTTKIKLDND